MEGSPFEVQPATMIMFITNQCAPCGPQGIAKLDLLAPKTQKECAVATIEYADGARGGEAYFVPRSPQGGEQPKGESRGLGLRVKTRD